MVIAFLFAYKAKAVSTPEKVIPPAMVRKLKASYAQSLCGAALK